MNYCEKCNCISENSKCDNCGFHNLREVKDDDFCFLATVEESFGKQIIELCANEGINCVAVPVGNGVRSQFALTLGNYQLYVPYGRLGDAKDIIGFFTEDCSTDKLKEKILQNIDKWHFESEKAQRKIRKKLKVNSEIDLLAHIKELVEKAHTINDVGLLIDNEHGLVVKSEKSVLWFSSCTFRIDV